MGAPVFHLELLQVARRGRQALYRRLYGSTLLGEVVVFYLMYLARGGERPGSLVRDVVNWVIAQQLVLLLLVTPALVAGTLADEKTRGTLQDLLTSNLSAAEIVLGKLLGQVTRLFDLGLLALPVLCFFGTSAGLGPDFLALFLLTTLVAALGIGAAALLASVWARSTVQAVIGLYVVGGLAVVVIRLAELDDWFSPLFVLEPAWFADGAQALGRLLLFTAAWGSVAVGCVLLATWRLRPAYASFMAVRKPLGDVGRDRPGVSDTPLRWKEARIGAVAAPAGWFVLAMILDLAVVVLGGSWIGFQVQGLLIALVAGLLAALRCSGAITREREQQTWGPLLLTPLDSRQLVRDKVWGVFDSFIPFILAYAVLAVPVALFAAGMSGLFWTIFWCFGTWIVLYFGAAVGIRCSAIGPTSARSLLNTLTTGATSLVSIFVLLGLPIGGLLAWLVASATIALLGMTGMGAILGVVEGVTTLPLVITLTGLLARAEALLQEAEQRVTADERVVQQAPRPTGREEEEPLAVCHFEP